MTPPWRVTVSAPSRLHLGLIDSTGTAGRRFGAVGIAIAAPRTEVIAEATAGGDTTALAPRVAARAGAKDRAALESRLAEVVVRARQARLPAPAGVRVVLADAPPAHAGFGSGTQLALAVGAALARLAGAPVEPARLGAALGRGRRSGVGLAAFAQGGLIVDGGHAAGAPASAVPPIVARHPLPAAWRVVVVVPEGPRGLSGHGERAAFDGLLPGSPERIGEICRLVLLDLLPAAVEADIGAFGQAVTLIQRLVGDELAPAQRGRFASPFVASIVAALLDAGSAGAGQSSWGPACYGIVGMQEAEAVASRMRVWLGSRATPGEVRVAAGDNAGARVTEGERDPGAGPPGGL